jgi:hypothetical protein
MGILAGVALYTLPFFFFFLVIWLIFRFVFWGRWGYGRWGYRHAGIHPAFADTIRNMSDDEYEAFKKKFDRHRMSDEGNEKDDSKR